MKIIDVTLIVLLSLAFLLSCIWKKEYSLNSIQVCSNGKLAQESISAGGSFYIDEWNEKIELRANQLNKGRKYVKIFKILGVLKMTSEGHITWNIWEGDITLYRVSYPMPDNTPKIMYFKVDSFYKNIKQFYPEINPVLNHLANYNEYGYE